MQIDGIAADASSSISDVTQAVTVPHAFAGFKNSRSCLALPPLPPPKKEKHQTPGPHLQ